MEHKDPHTPATAATTETEFTFVAETEGVVVQVEPLYLDEESADEGQHIWAYYVRIRNQTPQTLQLKSRYWRILDAHGMVEEVHGAGVVGEQPVIHPGETYEYESVVPLTTASGFMSGCYDMQLPDGSKLQVNIPTFTLDRPGDIYSLN